MNSLNYIKLEFPSKSSNEAFARTAAAAFATQLDPTMEELGDIKTAVSEAVTNAIVHAYPDSIGRISMRLRILDNHVLEISIRDWGKGIENVEQAMTPLFSTGGEDRAWFLPSACPVQPWCCPHPSKAPDGFHRQRAEQRW